MGKTVEEIIEERVEEVDEIVEEIVDNVEEIGKSVEVIVEEIVEEVDEIVDELDSGLNVDNPLAFVELVELGSESTVGFESSEINISDDVGAESLKLSVDVS